MKKLGIFLLLLASLTAGAQAHVARVPLHQATWGVLRMRTPIRTVDGTMLGNVPGGRFFAISNILTNGQDVLCVGHFVTNKFTTTVRLKADALIPLSGSWENLTTNQAAHVRAFFELNGEALLRCEALERTWSEKSPYFKRAVQAVQKFETRAKQLTARGELSQDQNRKATLELTRLRSEAIVLNRKHRQWKERNAATKPKPENDREFQRIMSQRDGHRIGLEEILRHD